MWIIRIYVCFSIEPFHTVQDSGFQIVVNYQVVVCQLQIYRWYPHQLYTSRLEASMHAMRPTLEISKEEYIFF